MSKQKFVIYIDKHRGIDNIEKFFFSVDEQSWKFKDPDFNLRIEKYEEKPKFATQEWVIKTINETLKDE